MESRTRPLTAKERTDLARLASPRAQYWGEFLSFAVLFMIAFALGMWGVRLASGPPQGRTLAWVAGSAALLALTLLLYGRRRVAAALRREHERHAEDLAHGHATCTTYEITDALRVKEFEDEGSAYYLKLTDGRVLFLAGQWLYEYEEGEDDDGKPTPARFPCRRFTIERAAKSALFLDLEPLGPALPPSGTLPPFTDEDHEAGTVPDDGDLLTLDFDSLRERRAG